MMNDESITRSVLSLFNDPTFQSEVAQIRAKALLMEVTDEIPPYKWTYISSRVIRNITAATFGIEALSEIDLNKLKDAEPAARQFALTWEGLAKLGEKTNRNTALMNASVAYELAGYQANAACLARQIGRPFHDITKPTVSELTRTFIQRLFLQVIMLAERVIGEPEASKLLSHQLLEAVAIATAAEGFAHASRYFLNGDENALTQAFASLKESEKSYGILGYMMQSNLLRSLRSLLPVMRQRSSWNVLLNIVKDNKRWNRYLKLLARGPGFNVLHSSSVSELWPSQIYALEKGLLSSDSSKVIRLPTSAGKTRIAELAMVHTMVTKPGAKCVYIAPYRALVWELEQAFLNLFGDLGFRVSSVVGTYESDDFEQLLVSDADVLVMTPEKLDLLQRAQPEFLDNVRLFVLDEGQIVQDPHRGVKFELLLTRLKRRLPNARFLFLSAVVPYETLEDFALWFNANPKEDVLSLDWRPSIQRFAKFEWKGENGVIRYSSSEDISLLQEFVSGVIKQRVIEFMNPRTRRINRRRFPDPNNKSQTAAELAYKFAELGPVLVFCSQRNFVEAVAEALETRLDLARVKGEKIPEYFLDKSSTRSWLSAKEWLSDKHHTARLLRKGIAVHHGNLPDTLRKSIELDFRNREFQILIATNTLAQGVNLPIRTVIVHSCWRRRMNELPERISARDYWNIAGRAGRAGRETEGTIIHIVSRELDERDYQYYLDHRKEVEPVQGALFGLIVELLFKRLTESALSERLDPETLALLVEEGEEFFSDEKIQSILNETLVQTQAQRYKFPTDDLKKAFQESAQVVTKRVSDKSYWPVYSSTGLSSSSCEILREYILENKEIVIRLLTKAGPQNVSEMASMFLDACMRIPEMKSDKEFGGSYNELLLRWLNGSSISEIIAESGDHLGSLEELANFIEDLFAFRLPWGISAFTRIATKELGLAGDTLSDYAQFFPTMVKFGVPVPSACWVLSAGIPFRKTGIAIALRFLQETKEPDYAKFTEWLGRLHSEDLHYKFGLEGPLLEDVSRALSRSGFNPLLKMFASSEDILPHETWVRGITYENRVVVASSARVDDLVNLKRDYDNPVDNNAVQVELNGQILGFLERQLAQLLAADIDCGLSIQGTIIEVERTTQTPQVKILLTKK